MKSHLTTGFSQQGTGVTRRLAATALTGSMLAAATQASARDAVSTVSDLASDALINVKRLGATGDGRTDDTLALQAAVDEARSSGRRVYLPAGQYRVTRSLIWTTTREDGGAFGSALRMSGDGITRSVIVAACAGPALLVDAASKTTGGPDHHFDLGLHLSDFGISGAHPESVGLRLRGQWYGTVERCRFTNHGRHGLVIGARDLNADWYITAGLRVVGCDISDNRGWGVMAEAALAMTLPRFERCRIAENRAGGLDFNGFGLELVACAVAANGSRRDGVSTGGGVWLRNHGDGVPNDFFRIEGCEFDDNYEYHVRLDYCTTGLIERNRFICNSVEARGEQYVTPQSGLWLAATSGPIRSLKIEQNIWMAVDDLAVRRQTHEFLRFDASRLGGPARRVQLRGSMYRLRPSNRFGIEILTFSDDDMTGETVPVEGRSKLVLRPMRQRGVAILRVKDEAVSCVVDLTRGSCELLGGSGNGIATAPADSLPTVPDKGVLIGCHSSGILWLANGDAASLSDWSLEFLR